MKFITKVSFFVLILVLLIPKPVYADDYVTAAIEGLRSSSVYIAPDTPNTDYNTPAELSIFLTPELNVVLVMLPNEALSGTDMLTIVQEISKGLDGEKTIGLAVGNKLIGYSTLLPEGVAAELMVRADSVSNNTTSALVAFSRNVQLWLVQNPQPTRIPTPEPTPTPRPTMEPIELPKAEDIPAPFKTFCLGLIPVLVILLIRRSISAAREAKIRAKRQERLDSFDRMYRQIREIEENVDRIKDRSVRKDLQGACRAAEGLVDIFGRSSQPLGTTEASLPALLMNVNMQVLALLGHESGKTPLNDEFLIKMVSTLINYDSLFVKLQENDPQAVELLASIIHSNNAMIASLGYLPEEYK